MAFENGCPPKRGERLSGVAGPEDANGWPLNIDAFDPKEVTRAWQRELARAGFPD